ncbi:hypothetical protein TEA_003093 [Camellia sinensis var. sinensis]|uniref:CBM20 domain-containing protein n=1 Tax=Camellia sinensis var. sinensis TaxID=542762 RepID=A0A4S4EYY4_CAMSN|nr:hypothetical protein TEA_003093 [Camellia sinensis var. sinensis]
MEAVTRSSTRILVNNFNGKSLPLSRAPLGKQINFFGSLILFSIPLKKTVQCVPLSKTEFLVNQTRVSTTADAGIQTMRDDPILSCWDASDAVPLNWSNGHLWTAELVNLWCSSLFVYIAMWSKLRQKSLLGFSLLLELRHNVDEPVERSIQFKYVLRGSKGEIFWQPSLGRFFQTWETNNTITITEDWENAEAQKITEQQMTDPNEELVNVFTIESLVDDSVTNLIEEFMSNVQEDVMSADDIAFPEDQQTVNRIEFFVTENETHQKQGPWVNAKAINKNQWKTTMAEKKPTSVEPEESVFTYEGGHVLVPDLNPMPAISANKAPHR